MGPPLVSILKPNGSKRLCADYKLTVNTFLEHINHPMSKIEELFTALQDGKTFSRLDFRDVFNQLETQKLLAWSFCKCIYLIKILPIGTKPASAKF